MSANTNAAGGGIGLGGLVFVVLLVLKLTKLAVISWFWVFFPLWIGVAAFVGITGLVMLGAGLIWLFASVFERIVENPTRRLKRDLKNLKR